MLPISVCLPDLYESTSDSWWEATFEFDLLTHLMSWLLCTHFQVLA